MAAVEVTISGMLYDKINRTTQNVVLIGEATLTYPPAYPPGRPEHPIYWPPHVEHPIVLPPIVPGGPPIDIGAHPEHPIVLPPPPDTTPSPPGVAIKPPPPNGGWAYVSTWGWGYYPSQTQAGPK